ncbi:hypothetical protein [Alkaliphilus hydrothermalis]|uniref:Uncharacterized protein n=1 Tax=Alkaliphilus hydrothermalis TaxID=1482730 RepID=A0ABS2NPI5_9FIRM|nr:hypothetical protein [Alkaliphilus hydrothermalis]MBM7614842.1 hypothetical protein [Alkaliphilus hydrothermalis]
MDSMREKDTLNQEINDNSIISNWLWVLPIIMLYLKNGSSKLNIRELEIGSLEKKAKLLNRIKGYMSADEQLVVHRAEMLLQIIGKVKTMMEAPHVFSAGTLSSLSSTDKKRHMLMDISEFVDEDKQEIIHKAINLHLKANHMEDKIKEIQSLDAHNLSLESIEKYIELFDPILEGQLKNKTKELKVLMGILKLMKSLEKKGQMDEMDLLEIIKPFVSGEQREQLTKMVQLAKVFGALNNDSSSEKTAEEGSKPLEEGLLNPPTKENKLQDAIDLFENGPKE